jgi:hypothetical protein
MLFLNVDILAWHNAHLLFELVLTPNSHYPYIEVVKLAYLTVRPVAIE